MPPEHRFWNEARKRYFSYIYCNVCNRPMIDYSGYHSHGRLRTRGHIMGRKLDNLAWVYMCFRCNNEQDRDTIFTFLKKLKLRKDKRRYAVAAIARMYIFLRKELENEKRRQNQNSG